MPNHVTNVVSVIGATLQDILDITDSIKELGDEEGRLFDFNRIKPMPEALRDTTSGSFPPGIEGLAMKKQQQDNITKYGYPTWYEFASKEWGTKWNSYDEKLLDNAIRFDTAWSTPIPVFEKLSAMIPHATIIVKHADEDCGYNCGITEYKDGEQTSWEDHSAKSQPEEDAKSFACELKYNNPNEWKEWEDED